MKKKLLSILLCLGLTISLSACGSSKETTATTADTEKTTAAETSAEETTTAEEITETNASDSKENEFPEGVVNISAITKNFEVYHRIAALVIEYDANIIAPSTTDAFEIIDTAMSTYSAAEEKRESDQAVITSIYTNDMPEMKENKDSSAGKYLILELQGNFPCVLDKETDTYIVENVACMATWRHKGNDCQWIRNDWSQMTITQKVDMVDTLGDVIAPACVLPTLQPDNVTNLIIDEFETKTLKMDGGYDTYYHIRLPENYDESKTYPLIVHVPGNGSRIVYNFQDDNGNWLNLRGSLTADQVTTFWTDCGEDVIILNPQIWKDEPEEWGCNYADDIISVVKHVEEEYSVDLSRVYAVGSSFGTMRLSEVIGKEPELFTAYLMCNGFIDVIRSATDSFLNTEIDTDSVTFTAESLMETVNANKADFSAYQSITEEYWNSIADSDLNIYMIVGANDEVGANVQTTLGYITYKEILEQKGFSENEINERLTLHIVSDEEMLEKGICKFHSCSKYAVLNSDVVTWLLTQ